MGTLICDTLNELSIDFFMKIHKNQSNKENNNQNLNNKNSHKGSKRNLEEIKKLEELHGIGDSKKQNEKKNMSLHWKILIGMALGVLLGFLLLRFEGGMQFIADWINPWGTLFIRLLKMIAVPLVFVSLFKGIAGMKSLAKLSRIGIRTLFIYVCTTIIAVMIGVAVATTVKPGEVIKIDENTALAKISSKNTAERIAANKKLQDEKGPLAFLDQVVPENIMVAAADNSKMLQIIFFTILLGIAVISISEQSSSPFVRFMDSFYEIMLKLIDIIISFAPYGVFALMAGLMGQYAGNLSILGTLLIYFLTVTLTLLIFILVFYPLLIKLFTNIPPLKFIKKMYPVQLFAFSTTSSAATLPINLKITQEELGISRESSSFVLPIGVTINMDGTSCYEAISIIFIAQVLGVDLSFSKIIAIILLTIISSIGSPGIPGGCFVILTMVLSAIGIPPEGLALILAIDRPIDMIRTSVNVTGDAVVAAIIDRYLGKKDKKPNKADFVPNAIE